MATNMEGSFTLAADQATVWAKLNDPQVLKGCIKGCETFERTGETSFAVTARVKVGFLRVGIKARIELQDVDGPNGCRIVGEGEGGVAGFATGAADVRLLPIPEGTIIIYTVAAALGGRLAHLGGRLVDGAAKRMADQFFTAFAASITPGKAGE